MESTQRPTRLDEHERLGIDWRSMLTAREEQARDLIRAHPIASLLGAAVLGFAIARLVREEQ